MNRHLQKRIRKIEECLYTREALASAKKAVLSREDFQLVTNAASLKDAAGNKVFTQADLSLMANALSRRGSNLR
jgi:hypothetical protein